MKVWKDWKEWPCPLILECWFLGFLGSTRWCPGGAPQGDHIVGFCSFPVLARGISLFFIHVWHSSSKSKEIPHFFTCFLPFYKYSTICDTVTWLGFIETEGYFCTRLQSSEPHSFPFWNISFMSLTACQAIRLAPKHLPGECPGGQMTWTTPNLGAIFHEVLVEGK